MPVDLPDDFQLPTPGASPSGDDDPLAGIDLNAPIAPKHAAETLPKPLADAHKPVDDDEPELSWADTMRGAAHNIIPSSKHLIAGTASALMHPIDTAKAFGQVGKGAVSKVAGMMGVEQDMDEKGKDEALINALGQHYARSYGSVKGFKKAVSSDPASVLMDVSTPLSLGLGAGAKVAGVTSTMGKALSTASKAASYADPVSATLGVAGQALRAPNAITKAVTSGTASVPKMSLDFAEAAGRTSDPAKRAAFLRHYHGQGDAQEILDAAQDGISKLRKDGSDAYASTQAGQAATATVPDYAPIQQASNALKAHINGPTNLTTPPPAFARRNALADDINAIVDNYASDPAKKNYIELDRLKRAIGDAASDHGFRPGTPGYNDAMKVYDAAKTQLETIAPGYGKLMDFWGSQLSGLRSIEQGLGAHGKAASMTALGKMLRAQKGGNGQDLLTQVSEKAPELPYMLSGAALHHWTHGGQQGFLEKAGAAAAGHLGTPVHAAGVLAATSPKVVGGLQYAVGALPRALHSTPAQIARYGAEELHPEQPGGFQGDAPQAEDDSQPRGARNNNMGNMEASPWVQKQPGYVGSDGRFAKFDTPENGHAANVALVRNKLRSGLDTVRKIAESWTPPGMENSRAAVDAKIAKMSRALGVQADRVLDTANPEIAERIANAIYSTEGDYKMARAGRASGGRVINHSAEAQKLISLAERSRKGESIKTEPLLNLHDDIVATALKTADKHI